MSACIWYISKYVSAPAARKGGTRAFRLMHEMVRMGHRCVILTSDSNHLTIAPEFRGPSLHETVDGVKMVWIRTLKYQRSKSVLRVLSWLHFEWRLWLLPKHALPPPDVVIVSSLSLLTVLNGLWLKRRYRCRLIFEVRDIWPLTLVCEGGFSRHNPIITLLGFLEKLGYRRADAIVGTMPNLVEHVAAVTDRFAPVHCIPMGVETTMGEPSRALTSDDDDDQIPECDFLVGYAGGIGVANSLETLFECARLMQFEKRVHFLVLGDGSLKGHYQNIYSSLPNIEFRTAVNSEALQSVLRRCDILVFSAAHSDRWKFGQSLNKLIDYMLAAKPIIASYSGYPSMINESGCGSFVPAEDVSALRDEILRYAQMTVAQREAIGAAGRDWLFRNRGYDKLARDYLDIALPGHSPRYGKRHATPHPDGGRLPIASRAVDARVSEVHTGLRQEPIRGGSRECIWYVSKYVSLPHAGRAGARAFMLMREMARLGYQAVMLISDSNHLTNVPKLTGRHLLETVDDVDVHWIRTSKFNGAKSVRRALSWLDFEWRLWSLPKSNLPRPDVVIVSSLSLLTIFNGIWLKQRYRCRLIFEVRDIWPLTITEEGGFSRYNPLVITLAAIEKLAYKCADAIVGTMPNLAAHVDQIVKHHGPVHCIPLGVDRETIDSGRSLPAHWADVYLPNDRFVVCHAGTIGITNALETLMTCARSMRDRPDVHFLLLGEGGLKEHYQRLTADLTNVTWAPALPKDQVQAALAQCDLLYFSVHVSKVWKYGLSLNKVIDYMLAGKPILASYSGHVSMIDESGAGTFVPSGDSEALRVEILRYVDMPADERRAMGEAGREWLLRNRDYRRLARDYLDLALPIRTGG